MSKYDHHNRMNIDSVTPMSQMVGNSELTIGLANLKYLNVW